MLCDQLHLCWRNCNIPSHSLAETTIKTNKDFLVNTNLPDYKFLSQLSLTNTGGVGFWKKDNVIFTKRDDLSVSKEEFEALWINIHNANQTLLYAAYIDIPVQTWKDLLIICSLV